VEGGTGCSGELVEGVGCSGGLVKGGAGTGMDGAMALVTEIGREDSMSGTVAAAGVGRSSGRAGIVSRAVSSEESDAGACSTIEGDPSWGETETTRLEVWSEESPVFATSSAMEGDPS
jgi:hypothetical protein